MSERDRLLLCLSWPDLFWVWDSCLSPYSLDKKLFDKRSGFVEPRRREQLFRYLTHSMLKATFNMK